MLRGDAGAHDQPRRGGKRGNDREQLDRLRPGAEDDEDFARQEVGHHLAIEDIV
jgi:hypothetical protein